MKEALKNVLNEILPEFVKNAEADILCAKLQLSGDLKEDEHDMIQACPMKTQKFLVMFTLLKAKPEYVCKRLQEICIEMDWLELYNFVQGKLVASTCDHLMMTKEEFETYQSKFKPNAKTVEEPMIFDVKDPDTHFVGREQQLSELHNILQRSLIGSKKDVLVAERSAIIAGLGGIGKTQLALKYAQNYQSHYDTNIVWIDAETDFSIRDSFRRLAQKLTISLTTEDGVEKVLKDLVGEIYRHFFNKKSLFIFDNADKPLRNEFYPNGIQKTYILITSRYKKWGEIKVFHLGNFTEEEALQFIKSTLRVTAKNEEKDIAHLANTLHFFPLAMKQATAYSNETNEATKIVGTVFTIDDYLKAYKQKKEELLSFQFFNDLGNTNSQTTFTTWTITIEKIRESTKKVGENMAITILNQIAYFASEKIDTKIFLTNDNDKEIGSAIELLKHYSMIDEENCMINVHPLIQEVTRLNLKLENKEMETFRAVCILMEKYYRILINSNNSSNNMRKQQFLPHLETLLSEIQIWIENNPSQRKYMEESCVKRLMELVYHETVGDDKIKPKCSAKGYFSNPWSTWTGEPSVFEFIKWKATRKEVDFQKRQLSMELQVIKPNFKANPNDGIVITWLGHATVHVQLEGKSFLTDPNFSDHSPSALFPGTKRFRPSPCTVHELPAIDAVVISSNHYDHLDHRTVCDLNKRFSETLRWYVPTGLREWFRRRGCTNVIEKKWWEEEIVTDSQIKIISLPSQFSSVRNGMRKYKSLWCSWAIQGVQDNFFFAGDTGYCPEFKTIGRFYGPFTIAAIPIGSYKPRWFMGNLHVDPAEAVQIHKDILAKHSLGILWGTYDKGSTEPILEPKQKLRDEVLKNNLSDESFFTLHHGQSWPSPFHYLEPI